MRMVKSEKFDTLAPKRFLPGINFIQRPTGDPHTTLVKIVQNSYCMNHVTLRWLSQTSCIFPVQAVVLEIRYFAPWRLSLHINDIVLWPTGVSHGTILYSHKTEGASMLADWSSVFPYLLIKRINPIQTIESNSRIGVEYQPCPCGSCPYNVCRCTLHQAWP
jgi:hypothetical protein